MAKTAKTPRKPPAKSTKTRRIGAARAVKPVKSAQAKSAGTKSASSRSRARRSNGATLGTKVDRCVATLDGWRKECTATLRELIQQRAAQAGSGRKPRRARKLHAEAAWIQRRARQLGLGLRHTVELADPRKLLTESSKKARRKQFNRMADFCKKELRELVALASRLDDMANPAPQRAKRKRK